MSLFADNFIQLRKMPSDIPDLALWLLPPPKGTYSLYDKWGIVSSADPNVGYRIDLSSGATLGPNIAPTDLSTYVTEGSASKVDTGDTYEGYPIYEINSDSAGTYIAPLKLADYLDMDSLYHLRLLVKAASGNKVAVYAANNVGPATQTTLTNEWEWVSAVFLTKSDNTFEVRTDPGASNSIYIAAVELRKIDGNHAFQHEINDTPSYAESPSRLTYDAVSDNWSCKSFRSVMTTTLKRRSSGSVLNLRIRNTIVRLLPLP